MHSRQREKETEFSVLRGREAKGRAKHISKKGAFEKLAQGGRKRPDHDGL